MPQFRKTLISLVFATLICLLAGFVQVEAQTGPPPTPSNRVLTPFEMQRFLAQTRNAAQSKHPFADALVRALARLAGAASTQPPLAPFLGNSTSIQVPDLLSLVRLSDCSLAEVNSSYQANGGGFSYAVLQDTRHYELTLHANALLTTAPDQFKSGCNDPVTGLYSRLVMYVGKTSAGDIIVAAAPGTAADSNDNIAILLLSPEGALKTLTHYATDSVPNTLAAGDLNGDGQNDVVSVSQTAITVFLGNSDGTFQQGVNYDLPSGAKATTIAIDDVTGDGKLDVLVAESVASTPSCNCADTFQFTVYPGQGDGTLGTPKNTAAAGPADNLITGAFHASGVKDVVTGIGQVFLNNGAGVFTAAPGLAFAAAGTPASAGNSIYDHADGLAAGDFNGDGKLDLALSDGTVGAVRTFLGHGDGTFTAGGSYAVSNIGDIDVTDLDGDGNLDIYVGLGNTLGFGGERVSLSSSYALMGDGKGSFQGAASQPFYPFGPQQPQSATPQNAQPYFEGYGASSGNVLDLNGDKKLDVLAVNQGIDASLVGFTSYLGNGNGAFSAGPSLNVSAPFVNPSYPDISLTPIGITSYALADFNGDGVPDLVYTAAASPNGNMGTYGPFLALGNGDGSFKTPTYLTPSFFPAGVLSNGIPEVSSLSTADFNHDGKADLIYYVTAGGLQKGVDTLLQSTIVQLGKGDGTFEAPIQVPIDAGIDGLHPSTPNNPGFPSLIEDVNGDGFPDLFVIQENGKTGSAGGSTISLQQLALYLGKGDGSFAAPQILTVADDPQYLLLTADLNGDGKPDLITTGMNSSGQTELATSLGNGDGTFRKPTIYLPVSYSLVSAGNLSAADFNGDGKPDLTFNDGVFLGNGDGTLEVESQPGGTSAPTQILSLIQYAANSVAADFNGDGRPDLLNGPTLLLNEYGVTAATSSPSSTSLAIAPNPATVGQSIVFTATVAAGAGATGTPTGTVTFLNGSSTLGTGTLSAGTATFATSALTEGKYTIVAKYAGDSAFLGSMSPAVSLAVNALPAKVDTTTTLKASASTALVGTSLTFTAIVTPGAGGGVPTGSVSFLDGAKPFGAGTLSSTGTATYSTSALAAGSHSISASYAGDTEDASSTSPAVEVTVSAAAPQFSITLTPSSGNVAVGKSVSSIIAITPVNGFNQAVALTCAGAPGDATCLISPGSVTPNGSSTASATLTIQTGVKTAALRGAETLRPGRRGGVFLSMLAGGSILGLALSGRRKRIWSAMLWSLALFAASALVACGSGSPNATPAGTYAITVTATAGSDSHTATYRLTVQ